jgi:hydroxymethylpyrimidine/phosphomethylpyrimidine kinase
VRKQTRLPIALTIAGSDSGGGAGIQADLKTFAALGVHGTSAITCLTAQNPRRVSGIQPATPRIVEQQLEGVFETFPPQAAKTGMLYSRPIIQTVAGFLRARKFPSLVVDPVMVATSGARLLQPAAVRALVNDLLPLAALVTPNLPEAEILAGRKLASLEDMRWAARELHARFGCAVLLKGGHLRNMKAAADILFDGREEWLLTAPFIPRVSTHGTGCTYSAAVTAHLARGRGLPKAVAHAKEFITQAIARSRRAGEYSVLGSPRAVQG